MTLFLAQVPGVAQFAPVGMVVFLVVFAGVFTWVFRRNSRVVYDRLEKLPLEGD